MKEFKRYISYMGKYRFRYWSIFVVTVVMAALLDILYSYANKMIFNSIEYKDQTRFQTAIVLCIVLVAIYSVFPYLRLFEMKVVRKIVFDVKMALFDKLMKLDMSYYEKHHSAEALKTLNWDANSMKDGYFSHIYWVIDKIVGGSAAIIAMLLYSPVLAVISIAFSIITVQISIKINQKIKSLDKGIEQKIVVLSQRLSDILTGFTILKMFAGASIVLDKYKYETENVAKQELKRYHTAANLEMISFLVGILGNFGTIIVGAILAARGSLDYGTVMAVVSLQMSVSNMVQRFGGAVTTLNNSMIKAGRVFDFLELTCVEDNTGKNTGKIEAAKGIAFEDVSFGYDDREKILQHFNLTLKAGEKVLLMGESGCGKSTVLKLLLRFHKEDEGAIQVFGRNINDYSNEELRNMITYVPQSSYLFEGTIRDNIAFGAQKDVTLEEIINASRLAYADEFIRDLPEGYDTVLSAGGTNLSGGQRQRIAIARAFLKDSPILLLDEPSSALDVKSERMINQAMEQLMENKIVLMVTHRMTSFEGFDRVVNL